MPPPALFEADRELKVVGSRPVRPDGVEKVTGKARFGADIQAPGMLVGMILRSPHAHARIRKIDAEKALALAGVKAVVTRDDFKDRGIERDVLVNVMAREKALYEGHSVAAVAATSRSVAKKALKLIEVDYEILPHVTDIEAAMAQDAPILHEDMRTAGMEDAPDRPTNIASRCEFGHGDVEAGFAQADLVLEREFRTAATHQGYIEPHACLANMLADGSGELWCCTQGHYMVRGTCADLLGLDVSKLRVTASEIGGGFGGKTTVFLEPVALALSMKTGRPVKITMSRDEVFKASGPTSSTIIRAKIGIKNDGTITAGEAELFIRAGPFPGHRSALAP